MAGEKTRLQAGQRFAGKYRVERFLGQGGMSTVYEATNLVLQSKVALKVLSDEIACFPEAVERFVREGVAASRVRHRAVVQVFDAGEHEGTPWIAMEYLEGESLAERYKARGALPPAEVLWIAREVAEGLSVAHDQGIIHRDLKPHNIFIDCAQTPPQPKILDFGIAKTGDLGQAKLTRTGMMVGTPHYMSPEQAQGARDVGVASDLWSLGVIMFEGVTGQMPFEAESVAVYLGKLLTTTPRDVRALAPALPPQVVALIDSCLKPEPRDRPQSARELIAELDRVLLSLPEAETVPELLAIAAKNAGSRSAPRAAPVERAAPRGRRLVLALAGTAIALNVTCLTTVGLGLALCGEDEAAPAIRADQRPAGGGVPASDPAKVLPPAPALVLIDTDPPGASVFLNGVDTGTRTPTTLSVPAAAHVLVQRQGYEPAARLSEPGLARMFFELKRSRRRHEKGRGKGHGKAWSEDRWEDD